MDTSNGPSASNVCDLFSHHRFHVATMLLSYFPLNLVVEISCLVFFIFLDFSLSSIFNVKMQIAPKIWKMVQISQLILQSVSLYVV